MSIQQKIKKCRNRKNLTQSELAARIPTSQSNYAKMELGITSIDIDTLKRLCEIFQVSSDYLLGIELKKHLVQTDYDLIYRAFKLLEKIVYRDEEI